MQWVEVEPNVNEGQINMSLIENSIQIPDIIESATFNIASGNYSLNFRHAIFPIFFNVSITTSSFANIDSIVQGYFQQEWDMYQM